MCKKVVSILLCLVIILAFPFTVPVSATEALTTITQENIEPIDNKPTDDSEIIIPDDFVIEEGVIYHSPDTPKPEPRKVSSLITEDGIDLCLPIESEETDIDFGLASEQDRAASFTDSDKRIELTSFNSSDSDFVDITFKQHLMIDSDSDNYYFNLQGGCTDGEYYYFGFVVKLSEEDQVDTRILCCRKNADGSFIKVGLVYNLMSFLWHINDMTYNSDTGEIIIVCGYTEKHRMLYRVSAEDLLIPRERTFYYKSISCRASSIDYNYIRNQYVVGITSELNYFAILDNNFNIIETVGYIGDLDVDSGWNRQGICADEQYIYSISHHKTGQIDDGGKKQNIIRMFDWQGNYVKTLEIIIMNANDYIYELENIMFADGEFFLSFCCAKGKERIYKYTLLSDYTFSIQYCPDENVENYIGEYNNGNVQSVMIRGVSTPLSKQRITKSGYKFCCWYAYRVEVDKWYYESPDAQTRGWYKEGQQPAGYEKYYYLDEQNVSQTGAPGDHVMMCAVWTDFSAFFVKFRSNNGIGNDYGMTVMFGQSTPLKPNEFTKPNCEFLGWNAYWSEKNKWYYVSSNGETRGWYKEGYQPEGYTKYVYADEQNVSQTAYAGGHIYMYALWDEFYIQYNANDVEIKASSIKIREIGKFQSGDTNKISKYKRSHLAAGSNGTFIGYNLYRAEVNKWYYQSADGTNKGWYKIGNQPNGYTLYVKTFPVIGNAYLGDTALPGEHLVLYAVWE